MFNFIENEHEVLKLWAQKNAFEQMRNKTARSKHLYKTLDGPITANASMGIHHAWGRTLKDTAIKYNTMRGHKTHFQNGFDAQGMWVEVEVEKHLGLADKRAISDFGLAKFTETCIDRVNHFAKIQTNQSVRLGQIMDWGQSYFTNSDHNIECIWHFLKTCHEKKMLVKSYKAMPWCPRCGTSLSEHEMSGSYKETTHKAVFFRAKLGDGRSLLTWTTTPWTLSANVAVAVNPENLYLVIEYKGENLIIGKEAVKVFTAHTKTAPKIVKEIKGADLIGLEYEPILNDLKIQQFKHKIIPWSDVSATEGTGAVHIAPGCGAEDFALGQKFKLQNIIPVDDAGAFLPEFDYLYGKTTTNCAETVFEKLDAAGKLFYTHDYGHNYPFCWRCKTDVIFKLVGGWDIATNKIKPQLLKAVKTVKWEPPYLQKTMEDWLQNMGDWNISRRRFYGLPLPIYECECGHFHVIGSREELKKHAVIPEFVDIIPHLHRPYIDDIQIKCPKCGKNVKRIPDVGDCWLDAGIAPFSTMARDYKPFDVVIEMKEQVRLWFYAQLFMSVVLAGKAPYKKVIGYGTVLDENGGKFSKSGKNNIVFDVAAEQFGADAIRYLYSSGNPAGDIRFGANLIEDTRKKLLAMYNTFAFYDMYSKIDKPDVKNFTPKNLDITDKFLVRATNELIKNTTAAYENHHPHEVVSAVENFVEELSNFYIRINRKRFWSGSSRHEMTQDKQNAYHTLYNAVRTLTLVMTPITPFMCETMWQKLRHDTDAELVVAADFPCEIVTDKTSENILDDVKFVRGVISLALSLRSRENLKLRQPLQTLYIITQKGGTIHAFDAVICAECNVKRVECVPTNDKFNTPFLTVNFKRAGAVLRDRAQKLKETLTATDGVKMADLVSQFQTGKVSIGEFSDLPADVFLISQRVKSEYVSIIDGDLTVVLDTTLNDALVDECILREIVRAVQVERQTADLEITARISLSLRTDDVRTQGIIEQNRQKIMDEVLAVALFTAADKSFTDTFRAVQDIEGKTVEIAFAEVAK